MICEKYDLWKGYSYEGEMDDGFRPFMETYILSGEKKRGMVVIFPGGGYGVTSPREAEPIAIAFNRAGYHAAVVYYSVAPRRHPQPVCDAARALSIISEKCEEWAIIANEIFVCGFSAGGHLCASISNMYKEDWLNKYDGIELNDFKINGSILCYPVIVYGENMHEGSFINLLDNDRETMKKLSMEKCVHENTPPAFIWHTYEDLGVPVENSMLYAMALRKHNIPFELHVYERGNHGLSLADENTASCKEGVMPYVQDWIEKCIAWLNSHSLRKGPYYEV